MTLFEINKAIENALENAIDQETGEIDFEKYEAEIEALGIAKEEKIKNTALYILNLNAEAKAKEEYEKKFKAEKQALQNKAKRMLEKLQFDLNGETFKCTEVSVSYRKSKAVEIIDEQAFKDFEFYPEYVTVKTEISPNKTAIKEAIERGEVIHGCAIVERQNIQVK